MTTRERYAFWLVLLAAVVVALYFMRGVLVPFVAGMAIAYFLDPIVDRCERVGASRTVGTVAVLAGFFLLGTGVLLLLVPLVQAQVIRLEEVLPAYADRLRAVLGPLLEIVKARFGEGATAELPAVAGEFGKWALTVVGNVISGGMAVANILSLLLITPIVAFYLLRDWDKLVARVDEWLPRAQAPVIREQAREIDRTLASFIRGQGSVCMILGVFYAIGLTVAGLDFGIVIGLFSGLISFVPFVGALLGGLLSLGLAAMQFDSLLPIAIVAGVFVAGQLLEGNVLTPNLVGDAVGLHPVWVIFALLAGGSLYGFLGVLLAVPAAAVIGVLTRFGLARYLASPLHLHGIPAAEDEVVAPPADKE